MVVHHVNIGLYSCAPENRWLYGPPGANAQISIWNIEQKSRGIIEHSLLLKSGAVCITKINIINKPNSYPLPNITRKLSQNFKAKTLSSFASVRAVKPLCLPVSDHQLSTILSCDVRYIGWFVGNFLFFFWRMIIGSTALWSLVSHPANWGWLLAVLLQLQSNYAILQLHLGL